MSATSTIAKETEMKSIYCTEERELARQLGVDLDTVLAIAEQAQQVGGDAYDDNNILTDAGREAVREEIAAGRPTLTITCDMEDDLDMAGQLPANDDEDHDTVAATRAEMIAASSAAWVTAAVRIGLERGYHVDAVVTKDESYPTTHTYADEDDVDTIEHEIWQAAHDETPGAVL